MKRKNSIICKWFAFNRSHYSKARRKIHWMCVFFLTPTFIRRIIIQLAMHKQMLDGQMKKSREKKSNKPTNQLCHSKAQLLITTFCHCSTKSIMFWRFLHRTPTLALIPSPIQIIAIHNDNRNQMDFLCECLFLENSSTNNGVKII